jgi:hypothetical protein
MGEMAPSLEEISGYFFFNFLSIYFQVLWFICCFNFMAVHVSNSEVILALRDVGPFAFALVNNRMFPLRVTGAVYAFEVV